MQDYLNNPEPGLIDDFVWEGACKTVSMVLDHPFAFEGTQRNEENKEVLINVTCRTAFVINEAHAKEWWDLSDDEAATYADNQRYAVRLAARLWVEERR
jgi:hypothetical protein